MNRQDLDAKARELGIDPTPYTTKAQVQAAIDAGPSTSAPPSSVAGDSSPSTPATDPTLATTPTDPAPANLNLGRRIAALQVSARAARTAGDYETAKAIDELVGSLERQAATPDAPAPAVVSRIGAAESGAGFTGRCDCGEYSVGTQPTAARVVEGLADHGRSKHKAYTIEFDELAGAELEAAATEAREGQAVEADDGLDAELLGV